MEIPAQGNTKCWTGHACGVTAVLNQPNSAHPVLPELREGLQEPENPSARDFLRKQTGKGNSGSWGLEKQCRNGPKRGI